MSVGVCVGVVGGGVFPEFTWMDASHPVLWPWTHSADIRQRGGGGGGGGGSLSRIHTDRCQAPCTVAMAMFC